MATASDIITALGGTSAVARELGLPPSTVSSWKAGARIPKWRMQGIEAMAQSKGIDLHKNADTAAPALASPGKSNDLTAAQQSEAA
ncbi:carph-isopro domain-containing protein [Sphingomonas bisphenolicum]